MMISLNENTKYTTARLYVEDYNRFTGELWLDFVDANEFNYFNYLGDTVSEEKLYSYRPSMIYVHSIKNDVRFRNGNVLVVPMKRLLDLKMLQFQTNDKPQELPLIVNMTVSGETFFHVLDLDSISVSKKNVGHTEDYLDEAIKRQLNTSWNGNPCNLENLTSDFVVKVWDVGQGNTNSISDGNQLTIFDMGCSKNYTEKEYRKIWKCHADYINAHNSPTLIISHWDVDHCNLLCSADDDFFTNLCCAFVPSNYYPTLTSKQILYRMTKLCHCVKSIAPIKKKVQRGKNHLHSIFQGPHYTLYSGESCKSKNNSGLALRVFGQDVSVFLTADHSNAQVWGDMYQDYSNNELNIVVPHHGSANCGRLSIPQSSNYNRAVISVGKNNYKHPQQGVIDKYTAAGFEVLRTDWERDDIDIVVK